MNGESKIERLRLLDEKALREDVLVPLLGRMGYKAVTVYHGSRERGKDIVCFDYDRLQNREYMAVVVKTADLDGSINSANGLPEVVRQVQQCFDVPYEDLFGMDRVTMHEVWVVTSGRVVSGAADSIFDTLQKSNLGMVQTWVTECGGKRGKAKVAPRRREE